jgi:hypothetical protein
LKIPCGIVCNLPYVDIILKKSNQFLLVSGAPTFVSNIQSKVFFCLFHTCTLNQVK